MSITPFPLLCLFVSILPFGPENGNGSPLEMLEVKAQPLVNSITDGLVNRMTPNSPVTSDVISKLHKNTSCRPLCHYTQFIFDLIHCTNESTQKWCNWIRNSSKTSLWLVFGSGHHSKVWLLYWLDLVQTQLLRVRERTRRTNEDSHNPSALS